ncbi:MAG: hypothetical protein DRJ42_06025 [Deltaproteobacteria bacterium]|nr:MAG: hypothetical protein DRJ42_06025 [Deltaproteobacteria bacterium]
MKRRVLTFVGLGVCLFGALGCSALGLQNTDLCDSVTGAEDCARALNAENGFPASCRPYRCIEGACVLEADAERCDGEDNDCDGDVDEDVFAPSGFVGVDYADEPIAFTVRAAGNEARALWTESPVIGAKLGATARTVRLPLDDDSASTALGHVRRMEDRNGPSPTSTPDVGCWTRRLEPAFGFDGPVIAPDDTCNFGLLEAAQASGTTFTAMLDTAGACPAGQLRLGELGNETDVEVFGPLGRSNSFVGTALTEDGACSAAVPARCQRARDAAEGMGLGAACADGSCPSGESCVCGLCLGLEQLAVVRDCGFVSIGAAAIANPMETVGLPVYGLVAAVAGSARCGEIIDDIAATPEDESVRDVAVLGVYLHAQSSASFVNATDEGAPVVVGQTGGIGAPAVLGVGQSFVVAYAAADGSLALNVIPELTTPPLPEVLGACEFTDDDVLACEPARSVQPVTCAITDCGSDVGVCVSGSSECVNGLPACMGAGVRNPDAVETCDNGLDDDCDGRVDEADCGACVPVPELCNRRDDDCDGMIDEDVVELLDGVAVGAACGTDVGPCVRGVVSCIGGQLVCDGEIRPRTDLLGNPKDMCGNGVDDDCDGLVEESTADCGSGCCDTCVATSVERCNGRDDDCDGVIDEDSNRDTAFDDEDRTSPARVPRDPATIRQCIATPPLPASIDENIDGFVRPFDHVVMAAGPEEGNSLLIGVAWREEAIGGGFDIGFRTVEMDTAGVPTAVQASVPVVLTAGASSYGSPTLAYSPAGFRVGDGVEAGGWFVLWATADGRLEGRRVTAEDGTPVDTEPFDALAGWAADGGVLPRAYGIDDGVTRDVGFVFVDRDRRQVVNAAMTCPPP